MAATGKTILPRFADGWSAIASRRPVKTAAVFLVLLAISGAIYLAIEIFRSPVERGTRALVRAYAKRRMVEARLSGGFHAGRYDPSTEDLTDVDAGQLQKARDALLGSRDDDPKSRLTYARMMLAEGKAVEALDQLRAVAGPSDQDPRAHNDLGACLLELGRIEDALYEFGQALLHEPSLAEALFNRALGHQKLRLIDLARTEFEALSRTERDPGWRNEIRQRLDQVSLPASSETPLEGVIATFESAFSSGNDEEARAIADRDFELLRRHTLMDLCHEHLRSAVSGNQAEAGHALSEIRFIARVFAERKGDEQIADLGRYLKTLSVREQRSQLVLISDYLGAVRAYESGRFAEAEEKLERLGGQFLATGNAVYGELASYLLSQCYYARKRVYDSLDLLKAVLSRSAGYKWSYFRARILSQIASSHSRLGYDSAALKECEEAIALCQNVPELEAKILQFTSLPYWHLGDLDAALARLRQSTDLFLSIGVRPLVFANLAYNYYQFSDIYRLRERHNLALLCVQQALIYAELAKDTAYMAEFSSFSAVENARLGQFNQADETLKRTFEHLEKLRPGAARGSAEAFALTNAGEVEVLRGDIPRALEYYSMAETLAARDEGNVIPKIDVLAGRAEAYSASGRHEAARSSLLSAIELIEDYRSNIDTSDQRSRFLDASQSVFDKLISLDSAVLSREREAFEMSERSRARTLLEEISLGSILGQPQRRAASPLTLENVQLMVPDDVMLLEYSVTTEGTFLFLITRTRFETVKLTPQTALLDLLVQDYLSDLQREAPISVVNKKAQQLYELLIQPVTNRLHNYQLCIVPDKALHFLPFAALVDGNGKYMVESRPMTYSPSASVFARCSERDRAKPRTGRERMVAVGNPEFNRGRFPSLQPLPSAAIEAEQCAGFYKPHETVLIGKQATEATVRAAVRDSSVAHFAVHCVVEGGSRWQSALLLSSDDYVHSNQKGAANHQSAAAGPNLHSQFRYAPASDPIDGILYLDEVYDLKLPRTRLVVLSACQSAVGRYYRGEGIVSLVRPFLAAGVPTVVASLWPVNSNATTEMMIEFHRLQQMLDMGTGKALGAAQAGMTRGTRYEHPYYWAAFVVVGPAQ